MFLCDYRTSTTLVLSNCFELILAQGVGIHQPICYMYSFLNSIQLMVSVMIFTYQQITSNIFLKQVVSFVTNLRRTVVLLGNANDHLYYNFTVLINTRCLPSFTSKHRLYCNCLCFVKTHVILMIDYKQNVKNITLKASFFIII